MSKENNDVEKMRPVPPFVRFVAAAVPMVFDDSLSYYEALCALWKYIDETVQVINNNAAVTEDFINQFKLLKSYVDNYFNNLDVQEEINNKLDQMAQNGELKTIFQDYLSEELTRIESELDNQIDDIESTVTSNYNTLNAKIDALSSGSPIPVSNISAMTDTSRIYVLTTTGAWYYYNGSSWVVGGQYQASQSIDVVEGLIYNEITNNLKYLLGFGLGHISTTTYQKVNSNDRICSNDFTKFNYDLILKVGTNVLARIFYYDDNGNHVSAEPSCPNDVPYAVTDDAKYYVIPADRIFKIALDYQIVPEGGRPVIREVETSYFFNNVDVSPLNLYRQKQFNELMQEGRVFDSTNLINYVNVCSGDFQFSTVNDVQYCFPADYNENNNRRLIIKDMQHYDSDIVIKKSNKWRPYLYIFDENGNYQSSGSGWKNIDNADYRIPAGTYFKMMMSILPTTTMTPVMDFYTNDIFKAIVIEKYSEEAVTEDRFYLFTNNFKYIKSVAHQGYTYDSVTYNQSRLGGYYKAKERGFNVGECDVKWTSDLIPVCCHNQSFWNGSETIVIADHTYAELQNYDYFGSKIASLDSVVKACKEMGMECAIDHLVSNWTDEQYSILFGIVEKYQMQDKTYWLQGISRGLTNRILNWYPKAKIALTLSTANLSNVINEANAIVTDDNEIVINFNYEQISVNQLLTYKDTIDKRVKLGIWTNDNLTSCLAYLPYIDMLTSNKFSVIDLNKQLYSDYSQYFN